MEIRYYLQGRFTILISMLMLSAAAVSSAEEITLTTYYPSPYGVYSEMRLYPKSSPTPPCQEGTIYYDSDTGEKGLKVCDGSGNPQPIGGGQYDNLNWAIMTATDNNSALAGTHIVTPVPNGWTPAGVQSWVQGIANTWGLRMVWSHQRLSSTVAGSSVSVLGSGVATGSSYPGGVRSTNYIPKFYNPNYEANSQIYDNGTSVGIGTASPQETLHVNGDIFVGGNFFKSGNLSAVNTAIGAWGAEGGVVAGFNNGRTIGLGQTGAGVYTGLGITSGSSLLASFYAGGEVGIGTYVAGPPLVRIWAEQPAGFAGADILVQKAGTINLRTQQRDRLTIDSSGRVGIGGWFGWANLDVSGSPVNIPGLRTMNSAFNRYIFMVPELGAGGYNWLSQTGDSGIFFSNLGAGLVIGPWAGGSYGIRITASGNVGIGEPLPADKLRVNGNVSANDYWIGALGRWASSFSDMRLKEKVQPITDVLDRLRAIKCVSFNWNEAYNALGHPNDKRQIGVIAQDVEQSFPELVISPEDGGYKSVNYDGVTAVLLEAVKEQQKQIEEFKFENEALKARLDAVEQKLK